MAIIKTNWIKKFEKLYREIPMGEDDESDDILSGEDVIDERYIELTPYEAGDKPDPEKEAGETGDSSEQEKDTDEVRDLSNPGEETDESEKPESSEEAEQAEAAGVSARGRVVSRMISYISNESSLGKSLKTGELRKKMTEPAWTVPAPFNMTDFDLENFSMKMLSSKDNPDLDHVILQLHGGGYMGAIRNAYYVFAGLYNEISHGMNVLCPDYRVAPEDPYPAALEDAFESYMWLLKRGYKAENIILAGDSAGGGLCMALCMYLRDNGHPLPMGIIAMSPWTDLTASGPSYEFNFDKDPLYGNTKESLIYINAYPGDHDKTDPYISPLYGSFKDFPPMLIQVGSHEMLLSDSESVAAKAREEGVKVRLHVYEGMFHDFQMAYTAIPESKKAWAEAGKFIEIIMKKENL